MEYTTKEIQRTRSEKNVLGGNTIDVYEEATEKSQYASIPIGEKYIRTEEHDSQGNLVATTTELKFRSFITTRGK
jgi:hypothetical protein